MSQLFFQPKAFERFPEIVAVHSLRDTTQPGNFSMVLAATAAELAHNRTALTAAAGFEAGRLAFPKLEHGQRVVELADSFSLEQRPVADAIMTDKPGWLIGVPVADCVAVLLYDPTHRVMAAVHSGWRGSAQHIAEKAVAAMADGYGSQAADLAAYLSPAPNCLEYEVGHEVSRRFDATYSTRASDTKDWFDNKAVVHDQLVAAGVPAEQIEVDPRSTITDPRFHSYRRDGQAAGRMLVVIGLKPPALEHQK